MYKKNIHDFLLCVIEKKDYRNSVLTIDLTILIYFVFFYDSCVIRLIYKIKMYVFLSYLDKE